MNAENKDNKQRVIDDNLKRVFDETLEAGIPDRFKALLDQLKHQEADQDSSR